MRQFVLYSGNERPFIEGYDIEAEIESDNSSQLFSFFKAHDKVYKIGIVSYDNFHDVRLKESPIQSLPEWAFVVPKYIKVNTTSGSQYFYLRNDRFL